MSCYSLDNHFPRSPGVHSVLNGGNVGSWRVVVATWSPDRHDRGDCRESQFIDVQVSNQLVEVFIACRPRWIGAESILTDVTRRAAVIYPKKMTVSQKTCHAPKRLQRIR